MSYGQESFIKQGFLTVAQFNGLVEIFSRPTLYQKNVEYIADIISYIPTNYSLHQ